MTDRTLVWLFPVVFLIHNGEELWTFQRFLQSGPPTLPFFPSFQLKTSEFAAAALVVLATIVVICQAAAREGAGDPQLRLYLFAAGVLAGNGIGHVLEAVLLRRYAPGVVTSVLATLPYSAYVFRRAVRAGWLEPRRVAMFIVAGFIGQAPLAAVALMIGKALVP